MVSRHRSSHAKHTANAALAFVQRDVGQVPGQPERVHGQEALEKACSVDGLVGIGAPRNQLCVCVRARWLGALSADACAGAVQS